MHANNPTDKVFTCETLFSHWLPKTRFSHVLITSLNQWRIQGRGPGDRPTPLTFRPNWGPKSRKKNIFETPSPPGYLRVWMTTKKVKLSENSLILLEIQFVWNNGSQKRSLSIDVWCPISGQFLACVASVSARIRWESWNKSKKRGMKGEGEGREGHAHQQTPRFWKLKNCVRQRTQFPIGAVLVVLIKY